MNLIFIGFRGTGKSSVGRFVAGKMGREFVDIDDYIENSAGKSIEDIFADEGEECFRRLEAEAIIDVVRSDNMVIATGGGAVISDDNVRAMKENGFLVLLEASLDVICSRLLNDTGRGSQRPRLTEMTAGDEIRHLLVKRSGLYHRSADCTIDTSLDTIEDISKNVIALFGDIE